MGKTAKRLRQDRAKVFVMLTEARRKMFNITPIEDDIDKFDEVFDMIRDIERVLEQSYVEVPEKFGEIQYAYYAEEKTDAQ